MAALSHAEARAEESLAREQELLELRVRIAELELELAERNEAIRRASQVCSAAANGNLEERVLHIRESGEVGEMLHHLNHLLDMTDAFIREAGATLDSASEEKFYRRVVTRGMRGTFRNGAERLNAATGRAAHAAQLRAERVLASQTFEQSISAVVETLSAASVDVERTAHGLMATAQGTGHEASVALQAARVVSGSVDTVAAAAEEMSASAGEIEHQAVATQGAAERALGSANQTTTVMHSLADASLGISKVVGLIQQVAGQIRLVALNATIEAAHAGEAGKGFAVVAEEVKSLATRTAIATDEISARVESIQTASQQAVEATAAIADAVARMHEVALSVRRAVAEQRAAIEEISRSMQDASTGTRQVAAAIEATSGRAVETREASDHMVASAGELARSTEALMSHIGEFLVKVRRD